MSTSPPAIDDHVLVLFGASGDPARRKLLPGLYRLMRAGLMPERFRIIGTSRRVTRPGDDRPAAVAPVLTGPGDG